MHMKADGRSVTVTLESFSVFLLEYFATACKAVQRATVVTWQNEAQGPTDVQA